MRHAGIDIAVLQDHSDQDYDYVTRAMFETTTVARDALRALIKEYATRQKRSRRARAPSSVTLNHGEVVDMERGEMSEIAEDEEEHEEAEDVDMEEDDEESPRSSARNKQLLNRHARQVCLGSCIFPHLIRAAH